jgi:hypothetical protein
MITMRTLLLSLALASAALADEVTLRNGSTFSGIVREQGDRVTIEMDFGSMTFRKVDVRSISRNNEDFLSQFEEKAKTALDVKSMLALAAWARDRGLAARASELYRKVLVLDPDQAEARKALGYEKVNGLWLAGDELMTARGFVKVNGRWMTKDMADRLLEQEHQERIENDRLTQLRREGDQRHEQEMSKIALERERLELERKHWTEERDRWWYRNGGWAYAPGPFGGAVGYLMPASAAAQMVPPTPPGVVPIGPPSPAGPSRR